MICKTVPMSKPLVDLLWRAHPSAPQGGARGPRARRSVSDTVGCAVALADGSGLGSVTVRAVAEALDMSTMSVYTHVNSRDDLLVLMADSAHDAMALPDLGRAGWQTRVRRIAEANRSLIIAHPWLLDIRDPRIAMGPGTIAKYDHELRAFDATPLDDVHRDAALSFVLDFVASGVAAELRGTDAFEHVWAESAPRLERYLGEGFPLARRVGQAAGERMGAPYSPRHSWEFGLERVIAGLGAMFD